MVLSFKAAILSISCIVLCSATFCAGTCMSHCNVYRMTVPKPFNYIVYISFYVIWTDMSENKLFVIVIVIVIYASIKF